MTTPEPAGAAPVPGDSAAPSAPQYSQPVQPSQPVQTAVPQYPGQPAEPAQPAYAAPGYPAPASQAAPPAAKKPLNVVGLISLIVAGLGFIFACIPGALIVGWILLPIGFVLSIVSLFLKGKGKGLGIAGLIVSIVGTIVGFIVFFTVVAFAFNNAFSDDTTVTADTSQEQAAPADEEEAPAAPTEGTRENPYPLGSVIESDEWRVVVNSVTLGATDTVVAANMFNEAPAEGQEYIVINYSATYLGTDADGQSPAFVNVDYVTADGQTVNSLDAMVVAPEPVFDVLSTLYTDGTTTGNLALQVPSATAAQGVLAITPGILAEKVFVAVQ